MTLLNNVITWIKKELSGAGAVEAKAEADLLNVAGIASKILTAARQYVTTNPVGETLLSIIEDIPGAGPIAEDVVNTILPKAISAVTTVQADADNPEALITAGLTAIGQKTDADELATAYTSVSALITNKIAPLLNVVSTIQTALSVTPAVYVAPVKAA